MLLLVTKKFLDKANDMDPRYPGQILEVTEERGQELLVTPYCKEVHIINLKTKGDGKNGDAGKGEAKKAGKK